MKRDSRMLTSLCIVSYLSDASARLSENEFKYLHWVRPSIITESAKTCWLKENIRQTLSQVNHYEEQLVEVLLLY